MRRSGGCGQGERGPERRVQCASRAAHERPRGRAGQVAGMTLGTQPTCVGWRAGSCNERAIRRCIPGVTTVTPAAVEPQVKTSTAPPDSVPKLMTIVVGWPSMIFASLSRSLIRHRSARSDVWAADSGAAGRDGRGSPRTACGRTSKACDAASAARRDTRPQWATTQARCDAEGDVRITSARPVMGGSPLDLEGKCTPSPDGRSSGWPSATPRRLPQGLPHAGRGHSCTSPGAVLRSEPATTFTV